MAQKVSITLLDDIDGESEAVETVSFGLDGQSYEIDLSEDNAVNLREALAVYVGNARKSGRSTVKKTGGGRPGPKKERDADPREVRLWAKEQGIEVPSRGRLPQEIVDKFLAA